MFTYSLGGGAVLGQLEPWHAEEFAAAVDHAREHLAPWIPFAHTVTDVDSARDLLQRLANDHAGDSRHVYGIWEEGRLIGGAIFRCSTGRTGCASSECGWCPRRKGAG